MPAESGWLSLRISDLSTSFGSPKKNLKKPQIHIAVPKKTVPLATRRNRIKRLIREVVRREAFFGDLGRVYWFRVLKSPGRPDFWDVKRTIEGLVSK